MIVNELVYKFTTSDIRVKIRAIVFFTVSVVLTSRLIDVRQCAGHPEGV